MAVKTKNQKVESFEDSMENLELILEELESGSLALDQLVNKYAKAKEYIKLCRKHLDDAELKISLINNDNSSEDFNLEQ